MLGPVASGLSPWNLGNYTKFGMERKPVAGTQQPETTEWVRGPGHAWAYGAISAGA